MDITAAQSPGIQQPGSLQEQHHGRSHHTVIESAATALGMSKHDVRKSLRGGESLDDLAQTRGVASAALQDAIKSGLKQADPTLSDERAGELADQIASNRRTAPVPPPPPQLQIAPAEPAPTSGRLIDVTV